MLDSRTLLLNRSNGKTLKSYEINVCIMVHSANNLVDAKTQCGKTRIILSL